MNNRPKKVLSCKQCGVTFNPQCHRNKFCSFECSNIARRIDLTGQRFGRLTVIEFFGRTAKRASKYRCKCDCGRDTVVLSHKLVGGHTKPCGCLAADAAKITGVHRRRHGHACTNSPTYRSWISMIRRCMSPTDKMFPVYGARGITVCERWRVFENFLTDMGTRPPGTSIDRFPNQKGDYEPGNCRWGTAHEQSQNSSNAKLTADAVRRIRAQCSSRRDMATFASEYGVTTDTIKRVVARETWSNIE